MTNLISQAEELAKNPPLVVYKKLMRLFSEAQLKAQGPLVLTGDENKRKKQQELYESTKKELEALATRWDQMVNDYKEKVALFSVTSICDFVAMCMMMIAAGGIRIERLKAALRGQRKTGTVELSNGDRVCVFGNTEEDVSQFNLRVDTWCKLEGNGIVQFKFPAGGDLHTFVLERAPGGNKEPTFIVYQGYQNTYSLAHFLDDERSVYESDVLELFHKKLWENGSINQIQYGNQYDKYHERVVVPGRTNLRSVKTQIGRKQVLDRKTLGLNVIQPLEDMLSGAITTERYVNMTGSPTTAKLINSEYMILLMCDQVSPEQFEANRTELDNGGPASLTTYPEYVLAS